MVELLLNGVSGKFWNARKLCPELTEEVYQMCDYLASVTNTEMTPQGVACEISGLHELLKTGRQRYGKNVPVSEYLHEYRRECLRRLPYVIRVVDAMDNRKFADECRYLLRGEEFPLPCRAPQIQFPHNFCPGVCEATKWWLTAILNPRFDLEDLQSEFVVDVLTKLLMPKYEEIRLKAFADALSNELQHQVNRLGEIKLTTDFVPQGTLDGIGKSCGIDPLGWPWHVEMIVDRDGIGVMRQQYVSKRLANMLGWPIEEVWDDGDEDDYDLPELMVTKPRD